VGPSHSPRRHEFLVPRSHTPRGALPRSVGLGSAPSVKTTGERPRLSRRGGCRNAADLQLVGCGPSWPVGNQIHIPRHGPQERQRRSAVALSRPVRDKSRKRARPQVPFPSGHILRGRHINRSDLGRPAVPKRCRTGRVPAAIGRSLRRSPGGPSTLTSPSASRPSGVRNLQRRKASVRAAKRARRSRGPGPSHASAESRARAHASTAGAAANSPSLAFAARTQHPWIVCTL
jgi:hypothetical protein